MTRDCCPKCGGGLEFEIGELTNTDYGETPTCSFYKTCPICKQNEEKAWSNAITRIKEAKDDTITLVILTSDVKDNETSSSVERISGSPQEIFDLYLQKGFRYLEYSSTVAKMGAPNPVAVYRNSHQKVITEIICDKETIYREEDFYFG